MGRRGPPKTPTALKILQGVPSGVRKLTKGEPKPELLTGAQPLAEMSADGQKLWSEIVPKLEELGLFSVLDQQPFRRYCELLARWGKAQRKLNETGQTHVPIFHEQTPEERAAGLKPRLRYLQELPESIEFRRLTPMLLKLEQQFGMTPAARAAISVLPKSKNAPDNLAAFLYGTED